MKNNRTNFRFNNIAQEITQHGDNYVNDWRYIVAITPCIKENGDNGTKVHYLNGHEHHVNNRCQFVLMQLAKAFSATPKQVRERAQIVLGENVKRKAPLALHNGFCLVPLKFRKKPRINDSTLGYVVLQYIKEVQEGINGTSIITFHKDAPPMEVMQTKKSVCQQIELARKLQEHMDMEKRYWDNDNMIAAVRLTAENWQQSMLADGGEELQRLQEEKQQIIEQNKRLKEEIAKQRAKNHRNKKK